MKNSEKVYVNKATMICYCMMNIVLAGAYILEFVKELRSVGYVALMLMLTLVPAVGVIVLYFLNKANNINKYIMGACFLTMYAFAILTTNSGYTYTYIFPMLVVVALFSDVWYSVVVGAVTMILNGADIAIRAGAGEYGTPEAVTDLEIRIAGVVFVVIFLILITACLNKISAYRLGRVQEEKDKADKTLADTLELSARISEGIAVASEKMGALGESVTQIQYSMKEISEGSNETADAVQMQLERSEDIQGHIAEVKNTADGINTEMQEALAIIASGKQYVDTLTRQVEKSTEANATVLEKMNDLAVNAEKMNNIIVAINEIANKTGLLALNASIEAARAGEAGRGFSVVAGEISSLASQTKTATVDITDLIVAITEELSAVSEAIDLVTDCNKSHAVSAKEVSESFGQIAERTELIGKQAVEMEATVEALKSANEDIVEGIQTISAITEEVSAHSGETYDACEENSVMVEAVAKIVEDLNEATKEYSAQQE